MNNGASKLDCPLRSDLLRKTIVMETNLENNFDYVEYSTYMNNIGVKRRLKLEKSRMLLKGLRKFLC